MKKYKTWEVFKILAENPRLEFISKKDETSNDDKYVKLQVGEKILTEILHKEWILYQKPVTLAEAVKAYIEDKIIYCEVDNNTYTYSKFSGNEFNEMLCNDGGGISPQEILRGKWYIEE